MVTVKFKIATGAFENPNIEGHFLPVSARRAILGSIGGVYFNQFSTNIFSFVHFYCPNTIYERSQAGFPLSPKDGSLLANT